MLLTIQAVCCTMFVAEAVRGRAAVVAAAPLPRTTSPPPHSSTHPTHSHTNTRYVYFYM